MRAPGERVGRYVILALLGKGGMGEVYEAEDSVLGRKVALKLVSAEDASADARERMIREARAAAAFEHPNVVLVLDAGVVENDGDGETYLAMELVRGKTLRTFIGDASTALDRRLRWLAEAARALAAGHARGIVHRDVKPDNMMIREDGALKVLDFGIAKRSAKPVDPSAPTEAGQSISTLTRAGEIVGTPRYASPEQLRGEPLDGRSDQFSWAVTAYELLSGRPPFDAADTITLLSQILGKPPAPLRELASDVPREVERAIARALSKDPVDRFESLDEAAAVLDPFAEARTGPLDAATEKASARSIIPPRTRRVVSRTAKVALYATAAFGTLVLGLLLVAAATGHLRLDVGGASSASAAPLDALPADLSKLRCAPAKIDGSAPGGVDLAAAVGVGACARLAIEIGADFRSTNTPEGTPVEVSSTIGSPSRVTIRFAGREATAEATSPLGAARKAARALAAELPPPAFDEARRKAWGAADAAAAHRLETTFRRLVMSDLDDSLSEIRELEASLPGSAWTHAMVVFTEAAGSPRHKAALDRALSLVDELPPARAKGLRGLLLMYRGDENRPEALRLLRQAYDENPADADIAGLYAAVAISNNALEEGFAVVDRVAQQTPALAIVPLRNAILAPRATDHERNERYLARLIEILPEDAGSYHAFFQAVSQGDFARARQVLAFRNALVEEDSGDFSSARLALLTGRPDEAIELAKQRLAIPVSGVRIQAALLVAAGHFVAGRLDQAHASSLRELDRLRDEGNTLATRNQVFTELRARRRSGEDVPKEIVAAAGDPLATLEVPLPARLALAVEMELLQAKGEKAKAAAALERLTQVLGTARREDQSSAALALLPLVRVARGDAAAAELWRSSRAVSEGPRSAAAFDAALALEATGAPEAEVVTAYRLAMDPFRVETRPLDYLFSALRVATRNPEAVRGDERVRAFAERADLPLAVRDRALALR